MKSNDVVKKLLFERCKFHITHLHAMHHLLKDDSISDCDSKVYIEDLLMRLEQDLNFLESMQ